MEANEALIELNKMIKMHDALNHAHKVIKVFAEQEKYSAKLEAAIKVLETKVDTLHATHTSLEQAIETHKTTLETTTKAVNEMNAKHTSMLNDINTSMKAEETRLHAEMNIRLSKVRKEIDEHKAQVEAAKQQKMGLYADIATLNEQIKAMKEGLMKLAGGIKHG